MAESRSVTITVADHDDPVITLGELRGLVEKADGNCMSDDSVVGFHMDLDHLDIESVSVTDLSGRERFPESRGSLPDSVWVLSGPQPHLDGQDYVRGSFAQTAEDYRPAVRAALEHPGNWYQIATYDTDSRTACYQATTLASNLDTIEGVTATRSHGKILLRGLTDEAGGPRV